jgi:hypothetical protein
MAAVDQASQIAASLLAPIEGGRLSLPGDEVTFVDADERLRRQVVRALAMAVQAGLDASQSPLGEPQPTPAPAPESTPAPAAPEPVLTRQQCVEVAGLLTRYAEAINRRCGESQDARRFAELLRGGGLNG